MNQGLLVIDIQNDYFKGGNMELVGMEEASCNANLLLQKCRETNSPIFHVQHLSIRPDATFFLPNSKGAEIHSSVSPLPDEPVITKHFPNSFRDTNLLDLLTESAIEELIICGAMSHMCIDATTRAAFDLGFRCMVIEDACATRNLKFKDTEIDAALVHASFMAALAVPYAIIGSTHACIEKKV